MKKATACLLTLFITVLSLHAADPAEGLWKSIDEKGKITAAWKIYQQNGALFGEIVTVPGQSDVTLAFTCKNSYKDFPISGDVSKMTVINTPFIYGLGMKSPGVWEKGTIIDPNDGKSYKCKITFRPADGSRYRIDRLEMRGEIGLGIGRSQYWERTTESEISALRK